MNMNNNDNKTKNNLHIKYRNIGMLFYIIYHIMQ